MTVMGWTGIEITPFLPECGRDRLLGPFLSLDGEYLWSLMQRAYVRKKKKQFGGVSWLKLVTKKMKKPWHAFIHTSRTSSLLKSLATRLLRSRLPSLNKCYLSWVHNQSHSSPYLFLSKNLVAMQEQIPHRGGGIVPIRMSGTQVFVQYF